MAYTTIDDPSAYFGITLYTGDGTTGRSITNDANAGNFQPDWLWIKERSSTSSHRLTDSSRGVNKVSLSSATNAELTRDEIGSYDTDGFTIDGTTDGVGTVNESSQTYVAWQWKANGGTTSSNTDGSITSTVQANTTAGFSIVTYTGTGATATFGHGLGAVPKMVIIKDRDAAKNWTIYHNSMGNDRSIFLNLTNAKTASTDHWQSTTPTSSIVYIGDYSHINTSGNDYVAYCFAEIEGYSKFGSYTGNGGTNGPFVYTGFKPAWIMYKRTDTTGNWLIFDNKRTTFNLADDFLQADINDAEATSNANNRIDMLSNGFKHRGSGAASNASSGTYIYMAFAEHPFVSSKEVPVTAG